MNNEKMSLIIIIVLLVLLAPCAVIGTTRHIKNKPTSTQGDDNPNHDFFYNGKLYFYLDNELKSTYDCSTCTLVTTTIDDGDYHTKYYDGGNKIQNPVLNNMFAIFSENGSVNLYLLVTNAVLTSYETIKTYNIDEVNNLILVKKTGLWGILNINDVSKNVDNRYDYLAAPAHLIDGKLDMGQLIAKNGDDWLIITSDGTTVHKSINGEIVDFNSNYYITYADDLYHVYDYTDNEFLDSLEKLDISILDNYVFIMLRDRIAVFSSLSEGTLKVINIPNETKKVNYKVNDGKYEIYTDDNLFQTIELGSNI